MRNHLASRIRATGPLTVADYMSECLGAPGAGYYMTRDPFGPQGDFVTAPEISQMFGELIGLWLATAWVDAGSPRGVTLAELGPGRGTLMADALRAARRVPGFAAAMRLHLVETSPVLRTTQGVTLSGHHPVFLDTALDLPEAPLFLIANEFFDALPVRQFIRRGDGWAERVIGLDETGDLQFGLTDPAPLGLLASRLADTAEGDLVEYAPQAAVIAAEIAGRIARHGGVALMIDYGDWHSQGDTLQALGGGTRTDPLADPGNADLTAHVDFEVLANAAATAGIAHTRLTPQGTFLERLGIGRRAEALAASLSGPALESHLAAHRRLTHPAEMGHLFKAMAFYPHTAPLPPGFAP